ncbi:Serine/threonine-protein kinase NEK [Giardia duodenalis]|uniref:Kinase, NEK n=2 Tax=Giardia intestinalis TaxID=5741 RepID=C6LSS7_GIAIB|nr:Kinase, NEK [Giardia intestinalis ATCC 50581]ESU43872.1 Serine/threonine-protein kinase NEK [Giardia intestinalis]
MPSYRLPEAYTWIKSIAKWPHGEVYLASRKSDGQMVAVKEFPLTHISNDEVRATLLDDLSHLPSYDHPNLIKYYDVIHDPDQDCVFLVMEYVTGGSLRDEINFRRDYKDHYSESLIWDVMVQVIDAIIYLQNMASRQSRRAMSVGAIFQNIKSSNILLMSRVDAGQDERPADHVIRCIKLSDYGFLRFPADVYSSDLSYCLYQMAHHPPELLEISRIYKEVIAQQLKGSKTPAENDTGFTSPALSTTSVQPDDPAPRIDVSYDGPRADTWSLACLLLELCNLCKPKFVTENRDMKEFFRKNVGIKLCKGYTNDVVVFLSKTLRWNPATRKSPTSLLELDGPREATERLGGLHTESYYCSRCSSRLGLQSGASPMRTLTGSGHHGSAPGTPGSPGPMKCRCSHCQRPSTVDTVEPRPAAVARVMALPPVMPPNIPSKIVSNPTGLMKACIKGDKNTARKLLSSTDVGVVTSTGMSALMYCAQAGLTDIAEALLPREAGLRMVLQSEDCPSGAISATGIAEYNTLLSTHILEVTGGAKGSAIDFATLRTDSALLDKIAATEYGRFTLYGETALGIAFKEGRIDTAAVIATVERYLTTEYGKTVLMRAAIAGDSHMVQALMGLESGAQDLYGQTALMLAILNRHDNVARMLVAHEAGFVDVHQTSALMMAIDRDFPETALLLIEQEAGLQDKVGKTALMRAIEHGNYNVAQLLVTQEAGMIDSMRATALHLSVEKGDLAMVELLLEREKTMRNIRGETALHIATRLHLPKLVKLLVNYEAGFKNGDGITALQYACLHDYADLVPSFLGKETGILSNDSKLAIEIAFEMLHLEIVNVLMPYEGVNIGEDVGKRQGGNSMASSINDGYNSLRIYPLHPHNTTLGEAYTSMYGVKTVGLTSTESQRMSDPLSYSRSMARSLRDTPTRSLDSDLSKSLSKSISFIRDYEVTEEEDFPPLIKAVHEDNLFKVYCLLQTQARITDSKGRTALMHAAILNKCRCIEFLAEVEANMRCNRNYTALSYACICENEEAARLLLKWESIDQSHYSSLGNRKTELMVAAENDDVGAVRCLRSQRRLQNTDGTFALYLAVEKNNVHCVRLLIKEQDLRTNEGKTAYQRALELKHYNCAYAIAIAGNHVILDDAKNTQLMLGCERMDYRTVNKFKAQAGLENSEGRTALMIAAENGFVEAVQLLKDAEGGALQHSSSDLSICGLLCNNVTALMYAAASEASECVAELVKKEAGMYDSIGGYTALMFAANRDSAESIAILAPYELGRQAFDGSTATMFAAQVGHYNIIQALLSASEKDIAIESSRSLTEIGLTTNKAHALGEGVTALMMAARTGDFHCLKALRAECGMSVPASNSTYGGWTALVFACSAGHLDCAAGLAEKEGPVSGKLALKILRQIGADNDGSLGSNLASILNKF